MASLVCCDGDVFRVDANFISKCKTLADCMDDMGSGEDIPLPNVSGREMKRILHYYDKGELDSVDDLAPVLLACDYLAYDELLNHGCKVVADSLRGKSAFEIKSIFGLNSGSQVTF